MGRQQYCVYNQTSECFLSLGVTLNDHLFGRLKEMLGKGAHKVDEGSWTVRPKRFHTIGFFSSRDLIYLDENHKVVHVIEAFRPFRIAPSRYDTSSVLALPVNSIYSSQTQQGNQLVICAAQEMEFRLRSMPSLQQDAIRVPGRATESGGMPMSWLPRDSMDERRGSRRRRWPRLIAYNSSGSGLAVHGVKDVSANGLYLVTDERWPMGSEVIMTLQRTDGLDEDSKDPINVKLRVIRWGKDGVALSFIQSGVEESKLMAMSVI
jgi:hypothetical protein